MSNEKSIKNISQLQNLDFCNEAINKIIQLRFLYSKNNKIDIFNNKEIKEFLNLNKIENVNSEEFQNLSEKFILDATKILQETYRLFSNDLVDKKYSNLEEQLNEIFVRRNEKNFCDKTLLYLLKKENINFNMPEQTQWKCKKENSLNYDIDEKIEGFMGKKGNYLWNDQKISDFISSVFNK
ncbi:hypothetical protein GVAV_002141 [Gurleya vavrai]